MSIGRRGVHPGIAVMHEVQFPKPFYLMMQPVYEPGADEIQYQQARQREEPERQRRQVEQTKMMIGAVIGCSDDQRGEGEIDDDGGQRKEDIQTGMPAPAAAETDKRNDAFQHPEEQKPAAKDQRPLP